MKKKSNLISNFWYRRSNRERSIALIGAAFIFVLLTNLYVIQPMRDNVVRLKQNVCNNQKMLAKIQVISKKLEQLRDKEQVETTGSFLAVMAAAQETLKVSSVRKEVSQIIKDPDNKVRVRFNEVSFDGLISWLVTLWNQRGMIIEEANVKEIKARPGMVSAEVVLHS